MSARSGWVALAVAVVATAAPLFVTRYLPFTDHPEHVAVMATLRHWCDPAFGVAKHYVFAGWEAQYLAYHLAGAALTFVLGDALRAGQVLLALVAIAYPLALRSLLRALGRDERLAIFACPLFYNRALVVGLHPYVAGVPLALHALALAVRQAERPTAPRAAALVALGILLFYTHPSALLVFGLVSAALTLSLSPPGWMAALRRLPARLAWLAPSAALTLAWALSGGVESAGAGADIERSGVARSLFAAPLWAHDIWRGHLDEALMVGLWACVLVIAVLPAPSPARPHRLADPLLAPLACAVLLYVVTPFRAGAAVMLDVRLAPFLVLFTLLPLAPRAGLAGTAPLAAAFVIALGTGVLAAAEISRAAVEVAGFDAILDATHSGARLVTLDFVGAAGRTFYPAYGHAGAFHRVRHGGVAAFSFSELPHWPLRFRLEAAPPPKPVRFWDHDPCLFRNTVDGEYYDLILVRGAVDPFADAPPGPRWQVAASTGAFTLFEKRRDARVPGGAELDRGPCGTPRHKR